MFEISASKIDYPRVVVEWGCRSKQWNGRPMDCVFSSSKFFMWVPTTTLSFKNSLPSGKLGKRKHREDRAMEDPPSSSQHWKNNRSIWYEWTLKGLSPLWYVPDRQLSHLRHRRINICLRGVPKVHQLAHMSGILSCSPSKLMFPQSMFFASFLGFLSGI